MLRQTQCFDFQDVYEDTAVIAERTLESMSFAIEHYGPASTSLLASAAAKISCVLLFRNFARATRFTTNHSTIMERRTVHTRNYIPRSTLPTPCDPSPASSILYLSGRRTNAGYTT